MRARVAIAGSAVSLIEIAPRGSLLMAQRMHCASMTKPFARVTVALSLRCLFDQPGWWMPAGDAGAAKTERASNDKERRRLSRQIAAWRVLSNCEHWPNSAKCAEPGLVQVARPRWQQADCERKERSELGGHQHRDVLNAEAAIARRSPWLGDGH
jgi:hypothetical protein